MRKYCGFIFILIVVVSNEIMGKDFVSDNQFTVGINGGGIYSLKRTGNVFDTNYIMDKCTLGDLDVRFRFSGRTKWQELLTGKAAPVLVKEENGRYVFISKFENVLNIVETFWLDNMVLNWEIKLKNISAGSVEVGDLAIKLPMNTKYEHDHKETFTRRVFKHAFISGYGSFLFWVPVGGVGPFLVMTPMRGTKLEYFTVKNFDYAWGGERYTAFIHSAATGAGERRGTWRQKHTAVILKAGAEVDYGFKFNWAEDYEGVRDILYENGVFDIRVAPGMVVPEDLFAMFSLRTKNSIERIEAEFPDRTEIRYIGEKKKDLHVYKVKFSRLGENQLTVSYDGGKYMNLEFFSTQQLEILIKKRAAFIVEKQQYRDPSKWYDGLFSLWDVRQPKGKNRLGPDNLGGQLPYAVSGSDDPSNCKSLYVSEKNTVYPNAKEIEALEYFLKNFVWGSQQRTDKEYPYPYGIYGCDNWKINRFAKRDLIKDGTSRPGGPSQCRMWRTFDYTTYFALYYNMYLIAKHYPHLVHYLDAAGYLERAFGTAKAYFEVPAAIRMEGGWSFTGWVYWQYTIGNFHEKYLLKIIKALEMEGETGKAGYLRGEWEKKVKYFLYDDRYPFVSEMPVDSTAYESSYVIAKYSLTHELKPDKALWQNKNTGRWYIHPKIDKKVHRDFMQRQLFANLACRGWLEASYYQLGSDFRALGSGGYNLSYMSQMGGWAILDQALCFEKNPVLLLRLGYSSMLSSWALVNCGTAQSNYGFWYPGKLNDGAAGWGFMPRKFGNEWNSGTKGIPRGPWPVDGEIDHGLTAGIEGSSVVVVDDPVFGFFAYGGELREGDNEFSVIPRDGVRRRLRMIVKDISFSMELDRDGFARERPILFRNFPDRIGFAIENRVKTNHTTAIHLKGLMEGNYNIFSAGKSLEIIKVPAGKEIVLNIPIKAGKGDVEIIIKKIE